MPAFNASASVLRAIASVRAQASHDWELIIVDDCSTDATAQVIEDALAAAPDDRIQLVRQDANRGVAVARNAGIKRARGVFLTFLDSDDAYLPTHLATFAAASRRQGSFTGEEAVRHAMLDGLTPFPWDKAFRRTLFDTVLFPEGVARFEDMMTNIVLYSYARRVVVTSAPTYQYFITGGSLTWGSVPTLDDTTVVWNFLDSNLPKRFRVGRFDAPYRTMRTLVSLLVAQSAIAKGRDISVVRTAVRECRRSISPRGIVATLRCEPRLGAAAILLKCAPVVYSWLYRRHIHRSFGMSSG
jgi:glycosyltransferase involved in cell wall biosynthesis